MKSFFSLSLFFIFSFLFDKCDDSNEKKRPDVEDITSEAGGASAEAPIPPAIVDTNLRIYYDSSDFNSIIADYKAEPDRGSYLQGLKLTGLIFIPINRNVCTDKNGDPYKIYNDTNKFVYSVKEDHPFIGSIERNGNGDIKKSSYPGIEIDTFRNANFIVLKQYVDIRTGEFFMPDTDSTDIETLKKYHFALNGTSSATAEYTLFNNVEGANLEYWEQDDSVNYVFFPISSILGLMNASSRPGSASPIPKMVEDDVLAINAIEDKYEYNTNGDHKAENIMDRVILSGAVINYGKSIYKDSVSVENIPTLKLEIPGGIIRTAVGLPCPYGWSNSFNEELTVYKRIANNSFNYLRFSNGLD